MFADPVFLMYQHLALNGRSKNTFFGIGIIDEEEQYGKQIVYPYQVSQSFTLFSFFSMFADQQKI